jgi:dihydroxyacid dehydratase/phosphogluconate dehydratase
LEGIEDTFGKSGSNPADFLYVYDDDKEDDPA